MNGLTARRKPRKLPVKPDTTHQSINISNMDIQIQLPTTTITRTIPDSWNDCTPEQAMTLLQLLQLDGPNLMQKRLSALAFLLQLTDAEQREWQLSLAADHGKKWNLVFAEQLENLMASIPWLLEQLPTDDPDAQPIYQLAPTLTKCPLPELILDALPSFNNRRRRSANSMVKLYPPADGLANITGEELAHLFTQYERYTADPSAANCDKLIAMLYRKSKVETEEQLEFNWYGDRRQPFNEHNIEARAQLLSGQLHPMAKNLILFWFLSCRMAIITKWPVVFKERPHQEDANAPDFGYWGVFRAITGDPLKVDELAKKPHQDFLTELAWLENERMRMEMEREMEKLAA